MSSQAMSNEPPVSKRTFQAPIQTAASATKPSKAVYAAVPFGALILVLAFTGCSSSSNVAAIQVVNSSIVDANGAVRQAEQRGARNYAPVELRSADEKIEAAQIALKKGEVKYAKMLAVEAEVDAELAEITALSTKSQTAVKEIKKSIDLLRQEIVRYQKKQASASLN